MAVSKVSKGVLSLNGLTAALNPWPLAQEQVIDGSPHAAGAMLWQSDDKRSGNGIWECTPGTFTWEYVWDETMYVIEGKAAVTDDEGNGIAVQAGDLVFVPTGTRTTWTVVSEIRKAFHFRSDEPVSL